MTLAEPQKSAAMKFIVCLGMVSLFADVTYEGARSILGPFMQNLGANAAQVGIVAGIGEMLAASLRFFSGRFADRTRAYWTITICGYAVNLFAVPLLAYAGNWWMAAILIAVERTGKSVRAPARDVLLSEATAEVGHGWGFGLHAAMDQTGAVLGPLLVACSVARTHRFDQAFLWLAIPAALAIVALLLARAWFPARGTSVPPQTQMDLPRIFWPYAAAAALLACGFADFALLAYHLQKTHVVSPAVIPILYSGAMAMNGLSALILGRLYDHFGLATLSVGILVSVFALPLAFLGGPVAAAAGIACWGLGLGAQDATLRSGISQVVSMNKRGSAFGVFNAIFGVAWFAGSAVMGLLYDHSIAALLVFGIGAQVLSAGLFWWLRKRLTPSLSKT